VESFASKLAQEPTCTHSHGRHSKGVNLAKILWDAEADREDLVGARSESGPSGKESGEEARPIHRKKNNIN